uniref:Restriction endonuclease type II-like domain-containing protein n=1 Tax=viral metagenome TaxID=1070528 RepID=A0A6H1ZBQ1_9ZZZZ
MGKDTTDKIKEAKNNLLADLEYYLDEITGLTQSPIEELFLLSFLSVCSYYWFDSTCYDAGRNIIMVKAVLYGRNIFIVPQHKICKYRVDFLFVLNNEKQFIVECDGHDFHEKTKKQVTKDKSREREFVKIGLTVVRFSGSEIYNSPFKCVRDLEDMFINYWSAKDGK